jgi:hypothetical protein
MPAGYRRGGCGGMVRDGVRSAGAEAKWKRSGMRNGAEFAASKMRGPYQPCNLFEKWSRRAPGSIIKVLIWSNSDRRQRQSLALKISFQLKVGIIFAKTSTPEGGRLTLLSSSIFKGKSSSIPLRGPSLLQTWATYMYTKGTKTTHILIKTDIYALFTIPNWRCSIIKSDLILISGGHSDSKNIFQISQQKLKFSFSYFRKDELKSLSP